MTDIPFSELNLTPTIGKAIKQMGFDCPTKIQSEAIPLIRKGADVIARSQTGTGKTIAFAIPAIEKIDSQHENMLQVLILCPTRELAQQATEEIRKVAHFNTNIHPVAIYGGTSIDKQCIQLRQANIVIGTPGRVMDHMRRNTLRLSHLKMVVLDEADEMLDMGFREDIETILQGTPPERQTVLFSATIPPSILKLTEKIQNNPQLIEINKNQATIEDIRQSYIEIPHSRKKDALAVLLRFYRPTRCIIFCNTKKMVDELTELLLSKAFPVKSIHGDMKQAQRTDVMQGFKHGNSSILIATDVAARGIDVSDVDFVINFDLPSNTEYYIHRIGRTGRAGKSGNSITLCAGKREVFAINHISHEMKSVITELKLPTYEALQKLNHAELMNAMETALQDKREPLYAEILEQLMEQGYALRTIAEAAIQLALKNDASKTDISDMKWLNEIKNEKKREQSPLSKQKKSTSRKSFPYEKILFDIGSDQRINANHIIGAITERTGMSGKEIGRVKIFSNQSIVEIPAGYGDRVLKAMAGCKINKQQVHPKKRTEPIKRKNTHRKSDSQKKR